MPWYGCWPGIFSSGSSVITKRPVPCTLTSWPSVASSVTSTSGASLAVARMRRSASHSTTSRRTGPSPWICITIEPLNLRLADSSAQAATISPSTERTAFG